MKTGFSVYILILGFTILMMTGGALIITQAQLSTARDMHTTIVTRLQASEYNEDTIKQCFEEVDKRNPKDNNGNYLEPDSNKRWSLKIDDTNNINTLRNINSDYSNRSTDGGLFGNRPIHTIELTYQIRVPFLTKGGKILTKTGTIKSLGK